MHRDSQAYIRFDNILHMNSRFLVYSVTIEVANTFVIYSRSVLLLLELCRIWPAVTPPTLLELCRAWAAVTPPTLLEL